MSRIRTHRPAASLVTPLLGWLAALAVLLLLAAGAQAQPRQDAAAAIQAWLHGPEAEGLAGLSLLAAAGDDDIRVLLGLIDKTPALQGPWLARLPRAERQALLRAPGGMSGRSWLAVAAETSPLAQAWRDLMQVGTGVEVAARLAALGEARGARQAVLTLAAREQLDLGSTLPGWLDPELGWLAWAHGDEALRAEVLARIPEDHPQRALMGLNVPEGALAAWLRASDLAAPLRAVCATDCPESPACVDAAYAALGSHTALLLMGSPAASLVPETAFLAAPRGRHAVLRRILLAADTRGRGGLIERARAQDACLGAALAEENARYRYVREGQETVED